MSESLSPQPASGPEIYQSLTALDNLAQYAIPDAAAKLEARRHIGQLAQAVLTILKESGRTSSLLQEDLQRLAANANLVAETEDDEDEAEESLTDDELANRLALTIPDHLVAAKAAPPSLKEAKLPRVLIATLERPGQERILTNIAAEGFDRAKWDVTDLGANVPILALTSTVMELRPGVVVLTFAHGYLLDEAARLVRDLKRALFGIKVVAVGPALAAVENLGDRLGVDLYGPEAGKAAELADIALAPLSRMSAPLRLDTSTIDTELQTNAQETAAPAQVEQKEQEEV